MDLLDNGGTDNGGGHFNGDGLGHMDGSGHFNDPFDVFDDVIRDIVGLLDMDGLVDGVDLLLDGDDGSADGLGTLQGGGHGDLEVRDGGLQDLGGVAGDVAGLSQVDLFGDDGFGFVDGGHIGFLRLGDVGSGKRDSGGFVDGSGNGSGVQKRSGSMSQRSGMCQGSGVKQRSGSRVQKGGGRGGKSGGKQGRKNELQIFNIRCQRNLENSIIMGDLPRGSFLFCEWPEYFHNATKDRQCDELRGLLVGCCLLSLVFARVRAQA